MNPYTHPKESRRLIPANTYYFNKDLQKKGKSDFQSSSKLSEEEEGDYETVSSSTLEAIHALRILPAKPPQESEYADKRCLKPPGATSPPSTHQSPHCSAKQSSVLEERSMAGGRGERTKINGAQHPVPPPRPLKTLPKQYQPLPPEPKTSSQLFHTRKMLSQAQAFPTSAKATSHLSVKEVNEVPGREQATGLGETPGMAFQAQQYKPNHHPEASFQSTGSSTSICSSGSMLNVENLSVKRSPSPMPPTACKSKLKHSLVKKESQPLAQPIEKDLNKYEWYIGEYDRQEAEEALLEESTDETFLVRNCSKKSNTEPYVLVVYYGRRVYNIKVRFLEESQQYALGTGLRGDDKFNSVKEIIEFYKYVPITLIDGKDKSGIQREQCFLTHPLKSHKRCFLP